MTGDANFQRKTTVGGFSQPSVARSLIKQSSSAEVGLTQRFLWNFPKPICSLEEVDEHLVERASTKGSCSSTLPL